MISRNRILSITDAFTYQMMEGAESGGEEEANKALKFLLQNVVYQFAFLESTGKGPEYDAWLKRVNQKHPGIKQEIEERIFIIEEV